MKDKPESPVTKAERPKPSISLSTLDDKKIKNYTVEDVVAISGKGKIKRISEMYDHKGEYEIDIELSDIVCTPAAKKKETRDKAFYAKAKEEETKK